MKRKCNYENELLEEVILNCKDFLNERNRIYLEEVYILLTKALEGVETKKDLTPSEQDTIKNIRNIIKGL